MASLVAGDLTFEIPDSVNFTRSASSSGYRFEIPNSGLHAVGALQECLEAVLGS
jgi:hypothetical protein